jgi:hypothetical protein
MLENVVDKHRAYRSHVPMFFRRAEQWRHLVERFNPERTTHERVLSIRPVPQRVSRAVSFHAQDWQI